MDAASPPRTIRRGGASRDRVTIDLRGLGPRLQVQADKLGITAAALVRRAVLEVLDDAPSAVYDGESGDQALSTQVVKVTLRLSAAHAFLLARRARVAEVSQGKYVAGLIEGTPEPPRAADHASAVAALMTSTDRLAALSADLNAFMRLVGRVPRTELEPYRASIQSLRVDVRKHLASAAELVATLQATRSRR